MKKIVLLCAIMLYTLALACASTQPRQDFNGTWVVDLEASKAINPRAELAHVQESMSNIVMTIDMAQNKLILFHKGYDKNTVMSFNIVNEQPGMVVVAVSKDSADKGPQLQWTLKDNTLIFGVMSDKEETDSFVFVRSE